MRLLVVTTLVVLGIGWASKVDAQTEQLRIQWEAYPGAAAEVEPGTIPPSPLFTVLERRAIAAEPVRHRNPELSADQLLIRTVNVQGAVIGTQMIPDPRILRSEMPGVTGELTGQTMHRNSPEFLVTIPENAAITEIRLYHPRWTGAEFALDLLGTISLR